MANACCSALAAAHSFTVLSPYSAAYNATENSYWSLQESSLVPLCIVQPHTSQQAASIVNILVSHPACKNTDFAIKGQTHAPAAGFANINDGVTIDMSTLSAISVNADHSIASVGAGASWLDVYTYLDPLGKSVAGGRNGAVGVGGLTLGGGISYFSPQVGFTCDTVANFELVSASGKLINANAHSNPDLFRALKGGKNNFGLVTRIDYRTLNISKILAGSVVNDISERSAVFKAFSDIAGAKQYDVHASIVTGTLFNSTSKSWIVSSVPVYTLPETNPKVYRELFAVPHISKNISLQYLHEYANEPPTPPLNWAFQTGTYGVSATFMDQIFDIVNSTVFGFEVPEGVVWDLAFEPLPTVFLEQGAGENSLGTSAADGNGMILLISALWPDSNSNAKVQQKSAQVIQKIDLAARKLGLLKVFEYSNYAGTNQRPIQSYGNENVKFLQSTSRTYDPNEVFQERVPGGFKLV